MKFLKFLIKSFFSYIYMIYEAFYSIALALSVPLFYAAMVLLPLACYLNFLPWGYLYLEIALIVGVKVLAKWREYNKIKKSKK